MLVAVRMNVELLMNNWTRS